MSEKVGKKKGKNKLKIVIIILLMVIVAVVAFYIYNKKSKGTNGSITNDKMEVSSAYRMSGNGIENFDLSFLKLENKEANILYSPLSIKYALAMLSTGANGSSKAQIDAIIGDYTSKKYINSNNMSFANALFIKKSFRRNIKKDYTDKISNRYDASVIYDSFKTPDKINNFVSDKTFDLINNLFNRDISSNNFFLVNALAIDMEWNKWLQATSQSAPKDSYRVNYQHEKYIDYINNIMEDEYETLKFNNNSVNAKAVQIGASINNYDIIKELGEENIRKTIKSEYQSFIDKDECGIRTNPDTNKDDLDVDKFTDKFISELKENYKRVDSSTDFMLYTDDKVKSFAKDLKTYNGTTLQYIGIMPKTDDLTSYVKNLDSSDISGIIKNLKEIKAENFTEGKITRITGYIPLFKFDYQLKLKDDLKKLGVVDVFDSKKADLSNMITGTSNYIDLIEHKANIEFSNEGIKAAAVVVGGGRGSTGCSFDHLYDVPVEEINITFDKPYLFLIRDKDTGEIWFVGTVYEPITNE